MHPCRTLARLTVVAAVPAALLVVGCGSDADAPEIATVGTCDAALGAALERWAGAGFSGAVVISGPVDCALGVGSPDDAPVPTADDVFSIGSVSKTVTGAAVAALVEDGTVTLDDTVGAWLPELRSSVRAVTVEQLLAHTGGLGDGHGADEDAMTLDEALAAIDAQELLFPPGTDAAYSNSGYTLLAAIVERASGRPWREFVAQEVLTVGGTRLGGFWYGEPAASGDRAPAITAEGVVPARQVSGPLWAIEGNGSLAFSARQLHDWTRALVDGAVLGTEGLALMTEPLLPADGATTPGPGWSRVDESGLGEVAYGSAGGGGDVGHDAVLLWFPEVDAVVVIVSNAEVPNAEALVQEIVPSIVTGRPIPVPVEAEEASPAVLDASAGTYEAPDGSRLEVTADGGDLVVSGGAGDAVEALFPPPADQVAAVEAHEEAVASFFAGGNDDGREEVGILEEDLGAVESVDLLGTAYLENELRTFVHIVAADGALDGWIALDADGRLNAVDYGQPLPSRRFVAQGSRTFVASDRATGEPTVALLVAGDGTMVTVQSGERSLVAERG